MKSSGPANTSMQKYMDGMMKVTVILICRCRAMMWCYLLL